MPNQISVKDHDDFDTIPLLGSLPARSQKVLDSHEAEVGSAHV